MTKVDQIISPKWVLISSKDEPQKNQSIVIIGNKIHDILEHDEALKNYKTDRHTKLKNHILLPGLINPYSQLSEQFIDEIVSNQSLTDRLNMKEVSSHEYYTNIVARLTAVKLVKSGTTSHTNVSTYPDIFIEIFDKVGIKLFCGLPMFSRKNNWSNNDEDSFKKNLAIYDKYKLYPNTKMFFCLLESQPVSQMMLSKIASVANELELPIVLVNDRTGSLNKMKQIFESLIDLNLINKNFTCIDFPLHTYVFELIEKYGINVVLSDVQEEILVSQDKRNNLSLFIRKYKTNVDMSLIRNIEHIYFKNEYKMSISEISNLFFKFINKNAAKVISSENASGSLETNNNADLISMNIAKSDVIKSDIMRLHFFDSNHDSMIDNVWIAGKHIFKNRKLVTINEHILYDEVELLSRSK